MLYILATPIGNLGDITLRALETLRSCDYILCEDTRRCKILLDHYRIQKPLISFHTFNEKKREEKVLQDLQEGKKIALTSDAGTPTISDPGEKLVQKALDLGLQVTALPGPCSYIQALVLSGLNKERFQCCGFLPVKKRQQALKKALFFQGISIFLLPARDLIEVLKEMPTTKIAVMRELTKIHEERKVGSGKELLSYYQAHPPKGEIVLLIEGGKKEELPLYLLIPLLQEEYGLSQKEAIKLGAKLLRTAKSSIYRDVNKNVKIQ